jgi:DNA-binding HxlR family transcriptional regulator
MAGKVAGMTRGAVERFGCPVARTAQIISNKWTPLIIRDLARGECRFSELERSLAGISPKTLSERLKYLEAERIIARDCYAEVPPRVEYSLTEKGRALLPIIETMRDYGDAWLHDECDEVEASETVGLVAAR